MALGNIPAGCRPNRFDVLDEKNDLLSLPLSSKGGEGNGVVFTIARQMQKAYMSDHNSPCRMQCVIGCQSPTTNR